MKRQYHVISAKNFGYESVLGDGTCDYFVFPADEFSEYDAMSTFTEVTKETLKANNHWYSYKPMSTVGGLIMVENMGNYIMRLFIMVYLMKIMFRLSLN